MVCEGTKGAVVGLVLDDTEVDVLRVDGGASLMDAARLSLTSCRRSSCRPAQRHGRMATVPPNHRPKEEERRISNRRSEVTGLAGSSKHGLLSSEGEVGDATTLTAVGYPRDEDQTVVKNGTNKMD